MPTLHTIQRNSQKPGSRWLRFAQLPPSFRGNFRKTQNKIRCQNKIRLFDPSGDTSSHSGLRNPTFQSAVVPSGASFRTNLPAHFHPIEKRQLKHARNRLGLESQTSKIHFL